MKKYLKISITCVFLFSLALSSNQDGECGGLAAAIEDCEKRAPFLLYEPRAIVKPKERFSIEVFVDFSDCKESQKAFFVDLNADGIYEISGEVKRDSFLVEGGFQKEGHHPVRGKVQGTYGTTDFYMDIHVTEEEKTPEEILKEIRSALSEKRSSLESRGILGQSDGVRKRRVLLSLGSPEERFWIDINLAYHVLTEKYGFTDEEIILLTYDSNVPASLTDFDPSWIDGTVWTEQTLNTSLLEDTFVDLSSALDGDDLLFFIFDGHGSGYYGPRTRRPYWYAPVPDSIYEGPIDSSELAELDDPDYREDEFQTEFIPSGRVNCVKYDGVSKGMDKFLPCFDYYTISIGVGDTYYRYKLLSHFEDLPLIDDSTVSDGDIYIEKIISYAKCDLNRNTIIEEDEIDFCDWDGDDITLMSSDIQPEFDEDDWHNEYSLEENYHPYSTINGLYYCFVDKNLDNTMDLIGFESGSDPLYLDCLAGQANPNDLVITGSDSDNNGYSDYLDINLDRDFNDYLSFDEYLNFGPKVYDDEVVSLFSMIDPDATKMFLSESCFSGGFLRDLSYQHAITISASEEDDTSSGNYFIRHFFMALNKGCEQFGSPTAYPGYDCEGGLYNNIEENLDLDSDDLISMTEAFRKAYERKSTSDYPMFDDNADLEGSNGQSLTFIHELPDFIDHDVPEGIYGDSTFLDEEFFGAVEQVSCYDFDGPLNFTSLSKIIHYGQYYFDSIDQNAIVDYVCDGRTYESTTRIDTVPPTAPGLNAYLSLTNITPQTMSGTKEADSSVWLNGVEIVPINASTTWSYAMTLTEGVNTISLTSRDEAGNESGTVTGSITLDTVPPIASLSGVPTVLINLTAVEIAVGGAGVTHYKYRLDDDSYGLENAVGTNITLVDLSEGSHTLYVLAKDNAGNWQEETDATQVTWAIRIIIPGDINDDDHVDLEDAILALQVLSGLQPSASLYKEADVNGDKRIGMEEVTYIVQALSGLRANIDFDSDND